MIFFTKNWKEVPKSWRNANKKKNSYKIVNFCKNKKTGLKVKLKLSFIWLFLFYTKDKGNPIWTAF